MADTADRKPFRSDDDLPADEAGGVDPLLELSQIAGFGPDDGAEPDERQIDLEDALLAELTPQETPSPDTDPDAVPAEPADLPPFIGAASDIDATAPTSEDVYAQAMEAELSPALPDPAPAMQAWPPHGVESAEPTEAAEPVEDIPAFLSTPEPDAAPAAPSLEDELAAMLAGDAVPTHTPTVETASSIAQTEPSDPMPDGAPQSGDAGFATAGEMDEVLGGEDASAPDDMSGTTQAADAMPGPFDPAPADDIVSDATLPYEPAWHAEQQPWQDGAETDAGPANWPAEADAGVVSEVSAAVPDEMDLDADFTAAFDEQLSGDFDAGTVDDTFALPVSADTPQADDLPVEPQPLDPVDELAAIMGYEPPADTVQSDAMTGANADDVERTLDDMDADFQSALDADLSGALSMEDDAGALSPAVTENAAAAPVLDTVDMSPFEGVPASDFDVPEFDHGDHVPGNEPADPNAVFSNEFGDDSHAARQPDKQADDGAVGAATATALAGAFDSAQFEAELARDMEFVSHDLNAERDADGLDLDAAEETAASAPAERSGRRGMVIGLVVAGLAIAGVAVVLALSGGGGTVDEGPVLVEADDTPVKIEPDDPGGTTVPNQERAVFADGDTTAPAQQNLVSTAEEPVDIATAPADSLPAAVAAGEKAEDRLTQGGTEASASDSVTPITPRRVRTLIVRPDGTLEERAPAPVETAAIETPAATDAASSQTAPVVEAPQIVAGVPVTDAVEPTAPANGDTAPAATSETPNEVPVAPAVAATAETAATADDTTPVVVRRVQTRAATPPVIRDRPSDQPVNVVNRQQVAAAPAATPAATPTPAAAPAQQAAVPVTTTGGSTGFSVQLAALPSEAAARATATRLSQQYGNLIAGRGLTIQRAVIDGRGTFYRVRVAANGSGDANALCNSIKASGGNCFVAR